MPKFLRQSGLSLVQGLIVSSLVAGSALISTRLIQDQKLLLKSTESRDQIDQLHRMVYATLQNREHCKATLVSNSIAVANLNDGARTLTKVVTKTNTGATADVFQINDGSSWDPSKIYMNGNVMIRSMTFLTPQATDPAGQNNITYPSKLRVEYARMEGKDANKRTKVGYGGKQIKKDIPIILQRNTSTGAIDGCYAVQLGQDNNGMLSEGNNNINQEFCSKLGTNGSLYIWDSAANKCVLKNNVCPPKFVFAGINSNGNANCKPLTDYLGFMVDTSSVASCPDGASVSLTTDAAGKVKVTCSSTTCPATTVSWTQSTYTCTASVALGSGSVPVTDSTAPTTGSGTAVCSAGTWTASGTCSSAPTTVTFNYTGSVQTWTVPAGVTSVTIRASGGGGGPGAAGGDAGYGGAGGLSNSPVAVTPGETLDVYVGGGGAGGLFSSARGWPNGGYSTQGDGGWSSLWGGTGGGASYVSRSGSKLVCAGGGGGGGSGGGTGFAGGAGCSGHGYSNATTQWGGGGNNVNEYGQNAIGSPEPYPGGGGGCNRGGTVQGFYGYGSGGGDCIGITTSKGGGARGGVGTRITSPQSYEGVAPGPSSRGEDGNIQITY